MNDSGHVLRTVLAAHEADAPDAEPVEAAIQHRARLHRRRRRVVVTVGGTTVGAGLVTGLVVAPTVNRDHGATRVVPAAVPTASSASPTPVRSTATAAAFQSLSKAEQERAWNAYFDAGYTYDKALELAKLWKVPPDDVGDVKAEAGRRLLAGRTLPVPPDPGAVQTAREKREVNAYFAAGYTYENAARLSQIWKLPHPYDAKVEGGRRLLAGEQLPIRP